jgi:hypothetical protein
VKIIDPKRIVAIGRKAKVALKYIGVPGVCYVRHPSRGGSKQFEADMTEFFQGEM